jgi:hypothetical protein
MEQIVMACLRLRTMVVAIAAVLVAAGLWQIRQVPLDVVPEFSAETLQVRTEALGLSAAEVESLITVPLEADLLIGLPWLKSIESESVTGVSSIELLFAPGTDLMRARQMVNERMTQARALPNVAPAGGNGKPDHECRSEFQVRVADRHVRAGAMDHCAPADRRARRSQCIDLGTTQSAGTGPGRSRQVA